jgi:hypothetical protein
MQRKCPCLNPMETIAFGRIVTMTKILRIGRTTRIGSDFVSCSTKVVAGAFYFRSPNPHPEPSQNAYEDVCLRHCHVVRTFYRERRPSIQIASFLFRQGNASAVPGIVVADELRVDSTWAGVTVPEPSSAGWLVFVGAGLIARRRRPLS